MLIAVGGGPRALGTRAPSRFRPSRSSSGKGLHHPSRPRVTGLTPYDAASGAYSPLGSTTTTRRPRTRARSSSILTTVLLPAPIDPATTTLGLDTSPAA